MKANGKHFQAQVMYTNISTTTAYTSYTTQVVQTHSSSKPPCRGSYVTFWVFRKLDIPGWEKNLSEASLFLLHLPLELQTPRSFITLIDSCLWLLVGITNFSRSKTLNAPLKNYVQFNYTLSEKKPHGYTIVLVNELTARPKKQQQLPGEFKTSGKSILSRSQAAWSHHR